MRPDRRLRSVLPGILLIAPVARAQGSAVPDFRPYVFIAYTAAFVLLFACIGYLFGRQRRLDREIDGIRERIGERMEGKRPDE